MKTILSIIMFLFLSTNIFSQGLKERTVLNNFILWYDNEETIKEKTHFNELNYYEYDSSDKIVKIRLNEYMYKQQVCNVVLTIINNELYSVEYVPKNDKRCEKYIRKLNSTKYNLKYQGGKFINWFNSYVEIYLDEDGNGQKYFIHYDSELLKKYPQYKDKL